MDAATFRELYERTATDLFAYLRFACRNADLARDLVQETYLSVLRWAPDEFGELEMKTYLYKTARSPLHDHWRKYRREVPLDDELVGDGGPSAERDDDLSHDMRRVLGRLGERSRNLLWLAYVEGFAHREIAEVLGVQEKSVRVMLTRARRQLAAKIAEAGLEPEGLR